MVCKSSGTEHTSGQWSRWKLFSILKVILPLHVQDVAITTCKTQTTLRKLPVARMTLENHSSVYFWYLKVLQVRFVTSIRKSSYLHWKQIVGQSSLARRICPFTHIKCPLTGIHNKMCHYLSVWKLSSHTLWMPGQWSLHGSYLAKAAIRLALCLLWISCIANMMLVCDFTKLSVEKWGNLDKTALSWH